MVLKVSIVTSIQSRSPDSDTPVALVKGDEGVAVVYLAGGSIHTRIRAVSVYTWRGWPTDWGPGFLLPRISSEDRDRRRGMSSDEIVIWCFV